MALKIYFGGSIAGGRADAALYGRLVQHLKTYGNVLTDHVGDDKVLETELKNESKFIHDRDIEWMKQADVFVAEVTVPSLGVGYEIGWAVALKVPTICLFRPSSGRTMSRIIEGAQNGSTFIFRKYEEPEFADIVKEFFASLPDLKKA